MRTWNAPEFDWNTLRVVFCFLLYCYVPSSVRKATHRKNQVSPANCQTSWTVFVWHFSYSLKYFERFEHGRFYIVFFSIRTCVWALKTKCQVPGTVWYLVYLQIYGYHIIRIRTYRRNELSRNSINSFPVYLLLAPPIRASSEAIVLYFHVYSYIHVRAVPRRGFVRRQ